MIEWNELEASDFCLSVRDGTHASPKESSDGKKLITSRHLNGYRLDLDNAYLISQGDFDEVNKRSKVDQWDVLISMIGTVGEVYLEREDPDYAIKNMGLFKSKDETSGRWLYYYLQSPEAKAELLARCRGTTQKYVPLGELRKFPVRVPEDVRVRDSIVGLLATLDDKIELNRRMNETLEEMARALFRDWFVDFGPTRRQMEGATDPAAIMGQAFPPEKAATLAPLFPARLGDDGLPEGWTRSDIGTEFDVVMGQSPPGDTYNETGEGLPFFQGRRDFGFRFPSRRVYCTEPKREAGRDWTLLSVRAPVGDINRAAEKCAIGRGVGAFLHKSGLHSFTYYTGLALRSELQSYDKDGTVFGSINQKQFKGLQVLVPENSLTVCFDEIAKPLDDKIRLNTEENQTLAEMRDLLLPKLMSGEIRLKDAEECT